MDFVGAAKPASPAGGAVEAEALPPDPDAFRLLVESITDDAIVMLDPDGRVVSWNVGAQRLHGYNRDEIVGRHFSLLYPTEVVKRQWPQEELRRAERDGRFEHQGWRVRKDGSRYWANVVITPLRDRDGRLLGFSNIARDLGDRRAAETRRESEERVRLIVENTTDYGVFMLDVHGNIASWNPGAERISGYRADEIIGRHFSVFYTPEAIERGWPEHELREAERVGRFEDEGWRVRKDGSRYWANVIITALRGADGELRGFGKITRDLSERKAQQERVASLTRELERRVAELAARNHELAQKTSENETFVYSVSHDLRSPLVNLQGFSQELLLARDELIDLLNDPRIPADVLQRALTIINEDISGSIGFIGNAVRHLSNIIDGLLRLSRVGRVEYQFEPVDVGVVVRDILAAMQTTVAQANATVAVGRLPAVIGDRNAIGQIFANIVGNALKSFDERRSGHVDISASDDEPPVFAIRDNGVGIPPEYRNKVFQVFQHVHPGKGRGEGMGLAIVRRIVERHGGRIWFESTPGEGTTFYFTLAAGPDRGPVRSHGAPR